MMSHIIRKNHKGIQTQLIVALLFFLYIVTPAAVSAQTVYAPGASFTIGEFVYDDNYVATTTDCHISIWYPDPSAGLAVNNELMTASTTGWHYYNFSGSATLGIWPATMSCGTPGVDLIQSEKTFIIATSTGAASDVSAAVWNNGGRTLTDYATSSIVDAVWNIATSTFATAGSIGKHLVTNLDAAVSDVASAVWRYVADTGRTLSSALLGTGPEQLATESYVNLATSTINTTIGNASSSIVASVNTNTASALTIASSSIAAVVNTNTTNVVSNASSSLASSLPYLIWSYTGGRTLSAFGDLAADVWNSTYASVRRLSDSLLGTGPEQLATESYVNLATSTLTTNIETASSSIAALINTRASLSSQQAGWTVTMSDFGETTTGEAYQVKLQVLNYETTPTDSAFTPTLTIRDSAGSIKVPNAEYDGVMLKDLVLEGTYYYSYTIPSGAVSGVWETEVSTIVAAGKTIRTNDYWWVSASPADVKIISIAEHTGTSITANVEITNKGTAKSDFNYVYCIVDSEDNLCGGNDDIAYKSETVEIKAQETLSLPLNRVVPSMGTYWFKVKARALSEVNWAAASEQFIASEALTPSCGNGSCSGGETCSTCPADCGQCGGGGGGGGGAAIVPIIPPIVSGASKGADLNGDNIVNSVDFSILLYFWKTKPPFVNKYVDMNGDGRVDSIDFSILLYQWGGPGKVVPVTKK